MADFHKSSPFRPMRTPFHALADSCHSCAHSEFPDGGRFCCAVSLLVQCICCIEKHFTAAASSGVRRAPRLRAWGFDKLNLLNRGKGLFLTSSVLISVLWKRSAAPLPCVTRWRGWRIGVSCCLATHDNLRELLHCRDPKGTSLSLIISASGLGSLDADLDLSRFTKTLGSPEAYGREKKIIKKL